MLSVYTDVSGFLPVGRSMFVRSLRLYSCWRADKFDELRVVYECGMDDGSDIPSDMVQGMLRYIWACHNPTDTGGFDAALKTIKNYKLDVMDVNSLRFTESVTITDSAGVVLATSVACSIKQHVNGMRDPIADIAVYFNTLSVIALGWNGVQGSLRVVWRAFLFIGFMPCNFTTVVPDLVFFVVQQVRRFGSPTGSSVSGAVPQRRYTATVWQTGTADPAAIIHENSLGREVSWNRILPVLWCLFSDPYLVATQESK